MTPNNFSKPFEQSYINIKFEKLFGKYLKINLIQYTCDVTAIEVDDGKMLGRRDVSCILPRYKFSIFEKYISDNEL